MRQCSIKSSGRRPRPALKRLRNRGYGLIAVMLISFVGLMFISQVATIGLQLATSERLYAAKARARRAAEIGLSYVVSKFNLLEDNPLLPEEGAYEVVRELPSDLVEGASIKVRLKQFTPTEIATIKTLDPMGSPLINPDWDPLASPTDWMRTADGEYFWFVDVTAITNGIGASLRVTLAPGESSLGAPPNRSSGVVANGNISLGDGSGYLDVMAPGDGFSSAQTVSDGAYASFKTAVQSNQGISLSSGATVYGDLIVNNPSSTSDVVAKSDNALVFGRMQTNASPVDNTQGFMWTNNANLPNFATDNVWGMADAWNSDFTSFERLGLNYSQAGGPISEPTSSVSVDPVPTPAGAELLPSFPGQILGSPSTDIDMYRGDFFAQNLNTNNASGRLVFNDPQYNDPTLSNDEQPATRIFIDPNTSNDIVIDASKLANMSSAKDLQIYYAGTDPITIKLNGDLGADTAAEFLGTIYAPRARVTTTGIGEFYGAILAKELSVNHTGDLRIDPSSAKLITSLTSLSGSAGGGGASAKSTVGKYRIASWQQVSGILVP